MVRSDVLVGIDGGGSSTVARAVSGARIIIEGTSGPGNVLSTPAEELEHNVVAATVGFPTPDLVAGCFAGLSNPVARQLATSVLRRRFPSAELRVAPDYVAALLASCSADVVVIAGTGSVCGSYTNGKLITSGGLGYLLGDRGSGFRYGQALVEFALSRSRADIPPAVGDALRAEFGTLERAEIVRAVHTAEAPAAMLARLARTLGECADAGEVWAIELVARQAGELAATVADYVGQHLPQPNITVELSGGVWNSSAVVSAFASHLRTLLASHTVSVHPAQELPVAGAVRLAALDNHAFRDLVCQGRAVQSGPR